MFKFWGDGSDAAKAAVDAIRVRDTLYFNWTFIFILAVVFYVISRRMIDLRALIAASTGPLPEAAASKCSLAI